MKRRILSFVLSALMLTGFLQPTALAAMDGSGHHVCDDPSAYCLVCDVAEKINALPEDADITLSNVAAVTDQIHAIDRIKFDLNDDQYLELLTLVDQGDDGSGGGLGIPVRYIEAVEAVKALGGGGFVLIGKRFTAEDGTTVDVSNAQVQLRLTNTASGESQLLTMTTMPYDMQSLSADGAYYSLNAEGDGWTYGYRLPAGTYAIEELGDIGATVDGAPFVTETTTYSVNGQPHTGSATITVEDGGEYSVDILNGFGTMPVSVAFVDETGATVDGATLVLRKNFMEYTFADGSLTQEVEGVGIGEGYSLAITPPEYYTAPNMSNLLFRPNGYEAFFDGESNPVAAPEGLSYDGLELTVTLSRNAYPIKIYAVDEDTGVLLSGAQIQLVDEGSNVVHSWTSADVAEALNLGWGDYTLVSIQPPSGYALPAYDSTFSVGNDGTVESSDTTWEDDGVTVLEIGYKKISEFYIPLKDKTLIYGEPFGGNIIDLAGVTCDGESYYNPYIGQAIYIKCKDAYDNIYETKDFALIPVGEYEVTGHSLSVPGPGVTTHFTFNGPVRATVLQKELPAEVFTVTAASKLYDGTDDAVLTVTIAKRVIPVNGAPPDTAGIEFKSAERADPHDPNSSWIYVYDAVTATATGSFSDAAAGKDKTVTYTITALSGADAANYVLPAGGITGTTTATIYPVIPDQDGDSLPEPDSDYDGIYEGTNGGEGNEYIPDGNGDYIVIEPNGDGSYTDDGGTPADPSDDKKYIPDQDGDGFVEPDSNGDGRYEGTNGGKPYVSDGNGGFSEYVPPAPDFDGSGQGSSSVEPIIPEVVGSCKGGDRCPSRAFEDLREAMDKDPAVWYHAAIDYVLNRGLMQGGDGKLFYPDGNLTRAMMVQILYNMEGKPAYSADNPYSDVPDYEWYYAAVLWAMENDIITGYDGKFSPADPITREQMAVILYRYACFKGLEVSGRDDLAAFSDGNATSEWALEQMQWAVKEGLLSGKGDGILDPLGTAARSEVAQIFMNYATKVLR